ncbi:MAG: ComF family protein [Flavobacteriaceae bacterium]|jgi:ComF family protein|nr:ComF family protein [Flavobacteriaceae bacterium]
MIKNLLNLVFPKCCLGCNTLLLQNEEILCLFCREDLPITHQHLSASSYVMGKFYGKVRIEKAACYIYFNKGGIVQTLFHQLKYRKHQEISYFLGQLYAAALLDSNFLHTIDEIVMVPLHPKKQKIRGYNQVEGFAKAISETFNIPINNSLLYKTQKTESQTTKSLLQRNYKKKEVFAVNKECGKTGTHFLLLDDILTTGATLEVCSKKLLEIPHSKVSILCLAQTV